MVYPASQLAHGLNVYHVLQRAGNLAHRTRQRAEGTAEARDEDSQGGWAGEAPRRGWGTEDGGRSRKYA